MSIKIFISNVRFFTVAFVIIMSPFYLSAQKTVSPPDSKLYSSLEWRHLGPFRGGRSCAVTGVPGKPNLFYFGLRVVECGKQPMVAGPGKISLMVILAGR